VFDGKIVHISPDFSEEYSLKPEGALISTYAKLVKGRVPRRNVGGGGG
jgi:hypothetical protein